MSAILNIILQANVPAAAEPMALEGNILIPSICVIMVVVMIAGIVITAQKHKRY